VVSVNMLIAELCHHDSKYMSLSLQLLGKQIVRYLEEQSIIYHCVTHVAQNHHYNAAVIADWMGYINKQIVSGKYWASTIVNIDETNIDFDLMTLANQGEWMVSIHSNGSNQCCTILLGVVMDGTSLLLSLFSKASFQSHYNVNWHSKACGL